MRPSRTCLLAAALLCAAGTALAGDPSAPTGQAKPVTNPALRDELLAMMKVDQAPRDPDAIDVARMKQVDLANEKRLKEIVATYGWPTILMVGDKGAQAAWLLAQHADDDPALQALALREMSRWVNKGEVHRGEFGYLIDRIAVNHGQLQTYGTQGGCVGPSRWTPKPMADDAQVDARRLTLEMEPLASYIAEASEVLCKHYAAPSPKAE